MAEVTEPLRLEARDVRVSFGSTVALDGVDLQIRPGEVHALIGENGAGKSTLMKVLAGAIEPNSGQLFLDGSPYKPGNPMDARRAGVAMIYQELSLAPHLSVEENVFLGMEPVARGMLGRKEMRERAEAALKQLGHGDIHPGTIVNRLSISVQQLVEIARAIALGCRVLILDEPTSSLTREDVEQLFALIRDLKSRNYAIIYISHFIEEIQRIADRFTVLRDGKTVGGGEMDSTPPEQIVALMVGRDVSDIYPRSKRTVGEMLLSVTDLSSNNRLEAATLNVHRGEVLGIAGLMGSGRTELLRAVFGLDDVTSGQIRVLTSDGFATPSQRWRQGAGMVSENRKEEGLALNLSIAENLVLPHPVKVEKNGLLRPSLMAEEGRKWIEALAVRCRDAQQAIGNLSGGNQQKVALARLLYRDADLYLLDEPTRGIDVGSKVQIYGLIDKLACENKAVVIVSSYLPELLGICDRIAVMCKGRLGLAREAKTVDEHSLMLEATAVETAGAA